MKKFIEEFKKFIARGNVIDLAVGLIMGSAFTAIVTALVASFPIQGVPKAIKPFSSLFKIGLSTV